MKKLMIGFLILGCLSAHAQNINDSYNYKKISTYDISNIDMSCSQIKEAKSNIESCEQAYLLTRAGIGCWMNGDDNLEELSMPVAASPIPVGLLGASVVYGIGVSVTPIVIPAAMLILPSLYVGSKIKRIPYTKVAKLIEASSRCVNQNDCQYKELEEMSNWLKKNNKIYDSRETARIIFSLTRETANCLKQKRNGTFSVLRYSSFKRRILELL